MDHSLNNLYSKVYQRDEFEPKKTLTNVYDSVLNEAHIKISFDKPAGKVSEFTMNDKEAEQLYILKSGVSLNNLYKKITEWVKIAGWDKGEGLRNIRAVLFEFLQTKTQNNPLIIADIIDEINNITVYIKSGVMFDRMLSTWRQGNIFNQIKTEYNNDNFKYIVDENLLKELAQTSFTVGQVSVGPYEALFTMFTEAGKAKKGDLQIGKEGTELELVELKGPEGRFGDKTTYTAIQAFNTGLKKEIIKYSKNIQNTKLFELFITYITDLNLKKENILNLNRVNKQIKNNLINSVDYFLNIKANPNTHINTKNLNVHLKTFNNSSIKSILTKIIPNNCKNFYKLLDTISSLYEQGKEQYTTNSFLNLVVYDQSLINCLVTNLTVFDEIKKSGNITQIISKNLNRNNIPTSAKQIAAALQLYSYYAHEGFNYLMNISKTGNYTVLGKLNPNDTNLIQNIINYIVSNNMVVGAGSGGRSGYTVSLP